MPERIDPIDFSSVRSILATDCGSTTTKAILIERQPDGEYRLVVRGEAPTTVEAPFDDVTVGVVNAVAEVEELSGKSIAGPDGKPMTPATDDKTGVDLYLSTRERSLSSRRASAVAGPAGHPLRLLFGGLRGP